MQSQDILILVKLISLNKYQDRFPFELKNRFWKQYEGIKYDFDQKYIFDDSYSVRGLSKSLGVSKSAISLSINRSLESGLVIKNHKNDHLNVNKKALFEVICYGVKYFFPAKITELTRGIPTSYAVFDDLMSVGENIYVWSDPDSNEKGQGLEPLYKSVPYAAKKDPFLYEIFAIIDAIRTGGARERAFTRKILEHRLLTHDV